MIPDIVALAAHQESWQDVVATVAGLGFIAFIAWLTL